MSKTESDPKQRAARRFVQHETNQAYNPVVSSEEVAVELNCSIEAAEELLEAIPHVQKKAVGSTYVWW